MAAPYTGVTRVQLYGDEHKAASFIGRARVHLGTLIERLRVTSQSRGAWEFREGDIYYRLTFLGVLAIAAIYAAPATSQNISTDQFSIWLPKGFIFYPATNEHPAGWGTPVVQNTDNSFWSPINLAPGLDVTRWTTAGRLGEVLLTRVPNAGYPETSPVEYVMAPYMASTGITNGPRLPTTYKAPVEAGNWEAYRIEFVDVLAQSLTSNEDERAQIKANKKHFFQLLNEHRVGMGLDPFLPPIRGRFDSAQFTAETEYIASTYGHHYVGYWEGYRASSDRSAKDGLIGYLNPTIAATRDAGNGTEEETGATGNVIASYPDPSGFPTQTVHNGTAVTGAQALAGYLAEPAHAAGLQGTIWNYNYASLEVGFRGAFTAVHLFPNPAWIAAGNRVWRSSAPELPPLSFFGFTSMNLAYETWPVVYNNTTHQPTVKAPLRADGVSPFWMQTWFGYDNAYAYGQAAGATTFTLEQVPMLAPTWDNRIFMRGRCIAVAPPAPSSTTAGWVLAAAIQKFKSNLTTEVDVYRLVAIVHHEEDQPVDKLTNGMSSQIRVWYCDIPSDGPLPCAPHSIIREAYGYEDHGWPWDVVNNPWSWRGGTVIDVGTTDGGTRNSLKYASQWVFSNDGMKAICLRDVGTLADYTDYATAAATTTYVGQNPRALELTFGGIPGTSPLTVSYAWRAANAGLVTYLGDDLYNMTVTPLAVDYDVSNEPVFAHRVRFGKSIFSGYCIVFGDYDVKPTRPSGLIYTYDVKQSATSNILGVTVPAVLDVKDQVVLALGIEQTERLSSLTSTEVNPDWVMNWMNSTANVGNVNVWRNGVLLNTTPYANPDATIFDVGELSPNCSSLLTWLIPAINTIVAPSYVSNGSDWALSFVIVPQTNTVYYAQTPGVCVADSVSDLGTSNNLLPVEPQNFRPICRGGWMGSSIGDAGSLASLMKTPGSAPRSLYVRVV